MNRGTKDMKMKMLVVFAALLSARGASAQLSLTGGAFNVYSSSVAVNGVYPDAVSAGTYGNITLPAANVAAGSLGSSVIASSVAVNAVYPSAVAAGTYSNVTLPSAKIASGAMVEGVGPFLATDCADRAAPRVGSMCFDTGTAQLYVSTSATTGGDYLLIGPP